MRGVVFHGDRKLKIAEFPDPSPGPTDVVVEMKASGMCGTDLHHYRGPAHKAPRVIAGHEPAGVIVETGELVPDSWIGRRVMVHYFFSCERCDQCRAGWTHLCREGADAMSVQAHGSHADLARVPFSAVLPIPDELSFPAAAAISCGTGTAWGALQRLDVRGDDTIAIFGQGPVGLSATLLASSMGAKVIAMDVDPQRLIRAREFGADQTINPAEVPSVRDAVLEHTAGRGASKSLDTSGAPAAVKELTQVLDRWGTACLAGRGGPFQIDFSNLLWSQVNVVTSWMLSVDSMSKLASYVAERGIDVDGIFTDRWELDQAEEAYALFDQQNSGKGVFLF